MTKALPFLECQALDQDFCIHYCIYFSPQACKYRHHHFCFANVETAGQRDDTSTQSHIASKWQSWDPTHILLMP